MSTAHSLICVRMDRDYHDSLIGKMKRFGFYPTFSDYGRDAIRRFFEEFRAMDFGSKEAMVEYGRSLSEKCPLDPSGWEYQITVSKEQRALLDTIARNCHTSTVVITRYAVWTHSSIIDGMNDSAERMLRCSEALRCPRSDISG